MHHCEYCEELRTPAESRFGRIYAGVAAARVVLRTQNFVVVPTLGQLFRGSLLVIPVAHIETLASLPPEHLLELHGVLQQLQKRIRQFGKPVFFEHGSTRAKAGACGIYHAHLHVVPLPTELAPETLLPGRADSFHDLCGALQSLQGSPHYLLAGDATRVFTVDVESLQAAPGSQYFRRRLASYYEIDRAWDWRDADSPEVDLLLTLEAFGVLLSTKPNYAAV